MDLKSCVYLEITKNERTYYFYMPVGAPFGEAYDAAFEALTSITELAKQAADNARPKEAGNSEDKTEVDVEFVDDKKK